MPGPHGVCSFGYQFDNYTNTKMSDNSQTESRLSSETLNLTCRRPSLDKIMLSYAITPHLRAYYGDYYSVMHLPFDGRSIKCLVSSYTVLEHLLSIDYKSITYNCKSLATLDLQIISLHVRLLLLELHQRNLRNRFNEYYRQDSMRLATAINVELPACEFLMTQLDKFLQDKIVEIWCVEAVLGERSDIHYMC
ncbi:Hypothetical protein PAS_chr4_0767 [Komagataella phaffii GS115]|uniref:Uncharacterized protein n=1 Tax=Komagataella phaffii (strain GS115 / ATCC 20864) TaxID=644223 RepID=C4R8V6_KOMPG|nr:Hypothetical protein PAS_chr4_0767 [Komagataella phaffii GS115]CAY72031.1 Hypothetical protein PAS_chr4_0767 [Komagataella phaffii GS115]